LTSMCVVVLSKPLVSCLITFYSKMTEKTKEIVQ
jgi:hypothetical protein